MLLPHGQGTIEHISCVSHDGKLVVVATDADGILRYTVKRDGYEDGALTGESEPFGFEDWRVLPLDRSKEDASVLEEEAKKLTLPKAGQYLLRSRYGAGEGVTRAANAPARLVSGMEHLYVFRQNRDGKILVNRFVLDGMRNLLVPKLEVRFRRSEQRLKPDATMKKRTGGLQNVDSLDYRDMNNRFFFEPALELSFIAPAENGWFDVVLLPTNETGRWRWHFFVFDKKSQKIKSYTVRASLAGLMDVSDYLYEERNAASQATRYKNRVGIVERDLDFGDLVIANGPSACAYDVQKEQHLKTGPQLVREDTRVMLAVPVKKPGEDVVKTAVVSFAAAPDGMLARLAPTPGETTSLRGGGRDVILPLDTLENIVALGQENDARGAIAAMEWAEGDRVRIYSATTVPLEMKPGVSVALHGTQSYDGSYQVVAVAGDTFVVEARFQNNEIGFWEMPPRTERGIFFDNMIVGYEKTEEGALRVLTEGHDLEVGDEVRISGTRGRDGLVPVKSVDSDSLGFVVDLPFQAGEALNLTSVKRRGLRFDGDDYLVTPRLEYAQPSPRNAFGRTLSLWVKRDAGSGVQSLMVHDPEELASLSITEEGHARLSAHFNDITRELVDGDPFPDDQWTHLAGMVNYEPAAGGTTTLTLLRDGKPVGTQRTLPAMAQQSMYFKTLDDYIRLPPMDIDFSNGLTIEAWTNLRWNGKHCTFFALGTSEDNQDDSISVKRRSWENSFDCYIFYGKTRKIHGSYYFFKQGQWRHVAIVFNPDGTSILYSRGNEVNRRSMKLPNNVNRPVGFLGRHVTGDRNHWLGNLMEVRLWNRPRTQSEIKNTLFSRLDGDEPGLVGYWPLAKDARDYSLNAFHGEMVGNPEITDSAPVKGREDEAEEEKALIIPFDTPTHLGPYLFSFDGNNHFQVNPFPTPARALTVSLWAKSNSPRWNRTGCLISKQESFKFYPSGNTRKISFLVFTGGPEAGPETSVTDLTRWHHYAGTWDGTTLCLYVDGVLADSKSEFTGTLNAPDVPLVLGADPESERGFDGYLADVRIYKRALAEHEIRAGMFQPANPSDWGLIGYWPLSNGETADLSPDGRDLVAEDPPTATKSEYRHPEATTERQALRFDGSSYVEVPGAFIDFSQGMTIECWVRFDEITRHARFLEMGSPNGNHIYLCTTAQTKGLFFRIFTWRVSEMWHDHVLESNEWTHVAAVMKPNGDSYLLKNGAVLSQNKLRPPRTVYRQNLRLGSRPGQNDWNIHAAMAEVRFWNRARTAEEIEAAMFVPLAGNESGLVGYWPLADGEARDYSGNGLHGTVKGRATTLAFDHWKRPANRPMRIGQGFKGELAGLSIWDRALSREELERMIHFRPAGGEDGLAGYWAMGAVVPGTPPLVADFSIHGADAMVFGQPYPGAIRLERRTDSDLRVVRFRNDDCFAVSARAVYEEQFQFKLNGGNVNVNNADGTDGPLFRFSYRGKSSRGAAEWIAIPPENVVQDAFESVGRNWYRARARVTVPDGVSLLRTFEIDDVRGRWMTGDQPPGMEWKSLEIRKHRIRMVSGHISRRREVEAIKLDELTAGNASWDQRISEFVAAERDSDAILAMIHEKLQQLEVLKDRPFFEAELHYWEEQRSQLLEKKSEELKGIEFYYWVQVAQGNKVLSFVDGGLAMTPLIEGNQESSQLWKFRGMYYKPNPVIFSKINDICLQLIPWGFSYQIGTSVYNTLSEEYQTWIIDKGKIRNYQIRNLYLGYHQNTVQVVGSGVPSSVFTWEFKPILPLEEFGTKVAEKEKKLAQIEAQLTIAEENLHRVRQLLGETGDQSTIESALQQARQDWAAARTNENHKASDCLNALSSTETLIMPGLSLSSQSLKTTGALLGFVQPQGPLQARFVCEGGVQLTYLDHRGQMRRSFYDATADVRDAHFEEWLFDEGRGAAVCQEPTDGLVLSQPVQLASDSWTLEAWIYWPLAAVLHPQEDLGKPYDQHFLAGSSETDAPVVIRNGRLGSLVDGFFHDSGMHLGSRPGWHHLAAVGQNGATTFYLNGTRTLELISGEAARRNAYVFSAAEDGILLKDMADFPTQTFTLALWFRSMENHAAGVLISYSLDDQEKALAIENMSSLTVKLNGTAYHANVSLDDGLWHHLALSWSEDEHVLSLFVDGVATESFLIEDQQLAANGTLRIASPFMGSVGGVSLWDRKRDLVQIREEMNTKFTGNEGGLVLYWSMDADQRSDDNSSQVEERADKVIDLTPNGLDGEILGEPNPIKLIGQFTGEIHCLGNALEGGNPMGKIAEFRIWNEALTDQEIEVNSKLTLTGQEPGLVGYWPLSEGKGTMAFDRAGDNHATVSGAIWTVCSAPFNGLGGAASSSSNPAVISAEYSATDLDAEGENRAMMRRFFGQVDADGVRLLADLRLEKLDLQWVGNQQMRPTLLGYIEGAPPVPSENLTLNPDYENATSVTLSQSEDVTYAWSRNQETGSNLDAFAFLGVGWEAKVFGLGTEGRVGAQGQLNIDRAETEDSAVRAGSSLSMNDAISLTGITENEARFPKLGPRFVPKNVGYALVVSGMADVFITRLARTGRMVGHEVRPVEGVPLDVNTITFMINPAYVRNGTLDGLVGSAAADPVFHGHVPAMRAQYGSHYPASYFRLHEAYRLKQRIERLDKERESFFENFDTNRLLAEDFSLDLGEAGDSGRKGVGYQKAHFEDEAKKREAEISRFIAGQGDMARASNAFRAWQRRMEDILIKAGKRNIVNTYVWDADGGLRSEEQSFANTIEHTIGNVENLSWGGGLRGDVLVGFAAAEVSLLVGGSQRVGASKTMVQEKNLQLLVDLSGVERRGITDLKDYPKLPGEKVDRYRFMSFFLEADRDHFQDFFNQVVDPEWLMSNDEEARALRQAMNGNPNRCWRVLHRVTHVERPALLGFGRDIRLSDSLDRATREIISYYDQLDDRHQEIKTKLDEITRLLQSMG